MNTHSKAYVTKLSSGTILALLAFSGFLFLIPITGSVSAANASLPTVGVTGNNPIAGGAISQLFTLKIGNPTSNQFTITGFTMLVPSGWTITDTSATCTTGGYLLTCSVSSSGDSETWSVSQFQIGTAAGIPPGASDSVSFHATAATGVYPFSSTFTSKVQDASSVTFYNGPSFSVLVIDPSTLVQLTVTPGGSNTLAQYTAGTAPYTASAKVTCTMSANCPSGLEAGVPVAWTATYPATATYSFTPASVATGSSGTAATSFQPSDSAVAPNNVGAITATIGSCTLLGCTATSGAITTIAGPPSKLAWYLSAAAFPSTHYVTAFGTTINLGTGGAAFTGATIAHAALTVSVTDAFFNPETFGAGGVTFAASQGVTLTALTGGGLFDTTNLPDQISCTAAACSGAPWSIAGSSATVPYNYYQSGNYGTIGVLSATITGTYGGSPFSTSGSSGNIVTSTFTTGIQWAASSTLVGKAPGNVALNIAAGSKVSVWETLPVVQADVPVTLYLDNAVSFEAVGGTPGTYGMTSILPTVFSGSLQSITLDTNSSGMVQASFTVDTVAGSQAQFVANVAAPIDGAATNTLGNNTESATVTTVAGSAASFVIITYFYADNQGAPPVPVFNDATSYAVPGSALYVDATLSDAYGNPITLASNANTIQVNLASSAGTLSATSVYITATHSDTGKSFGAVVWTLPSTTGSVTISATAVVNGVQVSAKTPISIVSKTPSIFVNTPVATSGTVYSSSNTVVFGGNASISMGYPAINDPITTTGADQISSVCYSISTVSSACTVIAPGASVTWSAAVGLTNGLHTVVFNATDVNGNTVTAGAINVLVDNAAPTVAFTTPTGTLVTYSSPVTATITVPEGDLNFTSVVATANGTALASSQVKVTPATNTLGSSTTYTVTITGLAAGTEVLGLSATSLAGLTGVASTITVTVQVNIATSVIITTAAYGTLGSFNGISASATNTWSASQNLVVFAVWKNSVGQTVAVTDGGLTLAAGASGSAFAPLAGALPSGTYTVSVFAITTANTPVSSTTSITASQ